MQTNTIVKKPGGRRPETLNHMGNSFRAHFVTHSSTTAFHSEVPTVTVIRDVAEFGKKGMIDQNLARTEGFEKQAMGEYSDVIHFQSDNGGRRLGLERRQFSYHTHVPERRSNTARRSSTDRRNGFFSRMNSRKWRDIERRAAFL